MVKKISTVMLGLGLLLILTACCNVKMQADQVDSWQKIKASKKVVIGLDDSFVPMGFRQKNGQLVGYDIDLAKAAMKKLHLKADFQTIDWSMKETELRNGTIDMIWNGYSQTKERQEKVAFSKTYLINEQILVTKKKHIRHLSQMNHKIVGLQSGSSGFASFNQYPQLLKQQTASSVQYDNFNNAFLDLDAKRIDGIVIDSVYASYIIAHKNNPEAYLQLKIGYPDEKFAVGLRKGDKTLRNKLNHALTELKKDGTIAKLKQKWFGTVKLTDKN